MYKQSYFRRTEWYNQPTVVVIHHGSSIELVKAKGTIVPALAFLPFVQCPKTSELENCALERRNFCHPDASRFVYTLHPGSEIIQIVWRMPKVAQKSLTQLRLPPHPSWYYALHGLYSGFCSNGLREKFRDHHRYKYNTCLC